MARTFDEVLEKDVGIFGVYQRLLLFAIALVSANTGLRNLSYVFVAAFPKYTCSSFDSEQSIAYTNENIYNNASLDTSALIGYLNESRAIANLSDANSELDLCYISNGNKSIACDNWEYDISQYSSTIVSQWDLVCSRKWLPAFSQSLHMAGALFGGLIFGEMADRYGRRLTLLLCILLSVFSSMGTAFSPNIFVFIALRFIAGTAINGQFNCGYILAIEFVGSSCRTIVSLSMMFAYSISTMILAGTAFLIRDWQWLIIATSSPFLLMISYYWLLPASPRWLLTQNKHQEAVNIAKKMAKVNRRNIPDHLELYSQTNCSKSLGVMSLLKSKKICLISAILIFLWFSCSTSYYGLSLYTSSIGANDYLSCFLSGLVEIPAYLLSFFAITKAGRRLPMTFSLLLAAITLSSTYLLGQSHVYARLALSMIGKLGMSAAFATIYLLTSELFPTTLRNIGLGITSNGGKIGGFMAPYINMMGEINTILPLCIFGGLAFISSILVLLLPEMHNQPLPETIEDLEKMKPHMPWHKTSAPNNFTIEVTDEENEKMNKEKYCLDDIA